MPVPATTGVERTKVSDMEIGDYIPMCYTSKYEFSVGSKGECPLTGVASTVDTTNMHWYMIKVAKGLLVSDRIWQHTISWDSLNSSKAIQGAIRDFGNIAPTMTSNISPSGVASASSIFTNPTGTIYDAWRAFDGVDSTVSPFYCWAVAIQSKPLPAWLSYQFTSPKIVVGYSIKGQYSLPARSPKTWTFEGWDSTENRWVVLDTRANQVFANAEKKVYTFKNSTPYQKYRINITSNNGDVDYVCIGELEMFETAGIIRSLGGGNAYTDENGNLSLTDKGYGASPWNEYDSYIAGFPADKIQAGKTLDDVFHTHVDGVGTWVQETPPIGANITVTVTDSSRRNYRGRYGLRNLSSSPSNTSAISVGFRPCFDYKE